MNESKDPNVALVEFLDATLANTLNHPSLRTMAAQVVMTYNKKFGASSIEANKPYMEALRAIALSSHFSRGPTSPIQDAADKVLEARINAAFQVLK